MPRIATSLDRFTASLKLGHSVVCDKQGNWFSENGIKRVVRRLQGGETARLAQIGEAFCRTLDGLEKTPAVFSIDERTMQAQRAIYGRYFKAAKQVVAALEGSANPALKDKLCAVQQRVTALQYRIEGVNGGFDTIADVDAHQLDRLTALATEWKHSQKLIVDKPLSKRDLKKLAEACRYPGFVDLLARSRALRNSFFKWAIRDNCNVQLFVEFPATVKRLETAHLYSRVSRLGQDALAIVKQKRPHGTEGASDKVVTMPFYDGKATRRFNILDESQIIEFSGGVCASIEQVFDVFVDKDLRPGNFEMFKRGVENWNCHEMGAWHAGTQAFAPIDLTKPQWWTQLPVLQTLSKEEIEQTYAVQLQPGEWLTCAIGSRKAPNLDLDNAHGYLKVFIPMQDGSYGVYPFGKFAVTFPHSWIELLKVLVSTNQAKVVYPDENFVYFFRQHANYPIVLTPAQGQELMELIKGDIIKGREGNLVFQFSGENCAHWVQDILNRLFHDEPDRIPNLFIMPLLEAEPGNPVLKTLFGAFKKAPEGMHPRLLEGLARILGSSSGLTIMENGQLVFKTTRDNSIRYKGTSYQPVHLHRGIETGKFKGILETGY